jgi:hypothetical protein
MKRLVMLSFVLVLGAFVTPVQAQTAKALAGFNGLVWDAPTTPGFEAATPGKKAATTHAKKSRVRSAS